MKMKEVGMKETNQSTLTMVFVLGLVLLVVGVSLIVVTGEVTRYRSVGMFSVPYKATIHPYEGPGGLLILVSISLIGYSIYSRSRKKTAQISSPYYS